ncbi:MAG: putative polyhydroxybutyrate depolymerase [Proteobacteria bacterium]|nr:putative polyhydroxybutyrate depolymerase [Pseudomonadota bacterium]
MNKTFFLALCLIFSASSGLAADKLGKFNIDPKEVSVSGVSSGGYMAMQYHSVFSASVKGAGVVAGGPYHCYGDNSTGNANNDKLFACMRGKPNAAASIEKIKANASAGLADNTDNLKSDRVYLFIGSMDSFVGEHVMDGLRDYYKAFLPDDQIKYVKDKDTGHGFITDNPTHARCTNNSLPGVNNCGYDQAGEILQWIYEGKLSPRKTGALTGKIITFDQAEFYVKDDLSMEKNGHLYLPAECAAGEQCKLHIVFHGCGLSSSFIGDKLYGNDGAGFNRWADANRMIVLYPQVGASFSKPDNSLACWDWWGYSGAEWDTNKGRQLQVIRSMVDRLLGSAGSK